MEDIIQYLRETQLKDLKGLHISGTIPLSDELLNQLIDDFVRPMLGSPPPTDTPGEVPPAPNPPPFADLLPFLEFPVLRAKTEAGKVVLEIEIKA